MMVPAKGGVEYCRKEKMMVEGEGGGVCMGMVICVWEGGGTDV